jgi:hypothetical protein
VGLGYVLCGLWYRGVDRSMVRIVMQVGVFGWFLGCSFFGEMFQE